MTPRFIRSDRPESNQPAEVAFRGYIAELDGLRAIAVILVLLIHFGPLTTRGSELWKFEEFGWVGVDLFFVLSGFLITGILLDSREKQRYYGNFYVRRALRIFPLYYAVLVAGTLLVKVWHGGYEYRYLCATWGHPAWFFFYVGNLRGAYLDRDPSIGFLIPLWSLQIEEQFYLLFPFLVRNMKPDRLFRILLCVVLLSGPIRWLVYWRYPSRELLQYLATPFRLDGLALGALVALRTRMGPWRIHRESVMALTVAMLGGLWAFNSWAGYQAGTARMRTFGYTVVALVFASVVLYVLRFHDTWQTKWLRVGPLPYLGKISYGMYLLQIPAYVCVRKATEHLGMHLFLEAWNWRPTVWWVSLFIGVVTVFFASLSWIFLEQPLLRAKEILTQRYLVIGTGHADSMGILPSAPR